MNFTQRREKFRAILEGDRCVRPAPVHDAISARLADALGFETGFVPGPVAQAVILAMPNHHICPVTLTEFASHCTHMVRATTNLALYVGALHGFGNAFNVMRTIEELESGGVACVTIDDQVEPVPFGSQLKGYVGHTTLVDERLIPLDEYLGRMKAALAARQDKSMVIAARCSALRAGDIPEAIRRVKAVQKIGVDACHLELGLARDVQGYHGGEPSEEWSALGRKGLEAVHAETTLPLVTGQEVDRYDIDYLGRNGIRIGQAGNLTLRIGIKAMYESLVAWKEGKLTKEQAPKVASSELFGHSVRVKEYDVMFKQFMTQEGVGPV